jgi:T5SS/PEP-CTERM-associated repeat protein
MKTNWIRDIVAVAAVTAALVAQTGYGVDYVWSGGGDGSTFSDAANWTPSSAAPVGAADRAIFKTPGTFNVNVTQAFTNAGVMVQQGNVTFNAGSAYFYTTALQIGTQKFHQATFTMITCTGKVGALDVGRVYDPATGNGTAGSLNLLAKARLISVGQVSIGYYNGAVALTGTVVVSDSALSTASNANMYVGYGGVGRLSVTNGSHVDCKVFSMNERKGLTNFPIRTTVQVGGGSGASVLKIFGANSLNSVGTYPNGFEYMREPITSEIIIYPGGVVHDENGPFIYYPGSTLTLAGGEFYERYNNLVFTGSVFRGSGQVRVLSKAYPQFYVSLRPSAGVCDWPWGAVTVTNYAKMSPGTPESPIGAIELKDWSGPLEVRPKCMLDFDLAGTAAGEYDRILATNGTVYLGLMSSPGSGGAIINVALTNNFVPVNGNYFDVLTCTNIIESDLSLVTFNWPAQPANLTWTPSIITNVVPRYTNEVLRLTVSGGAPKGTLITVW